ncbi:MAG: hypothetical protein L3J47_09065, partial [Sulfurovum sp.]|nr:hypothetical protein [Sulfurovum sp.]
MSKLMIVNLNSADKTLASYKVDPAGKTVHIKARSNVNYDLIEKQTGYAPENIIAKRVGNDLQITFEGGDIAHPDVIIEDYYAHSGELVVGQAENGLYYNYVPETAADADAISALDIGDAAAQALGGEGVITPLWILGEGALTGFSGMELLAGVAGVGGIAAAAGGGGGSDAPAPNPSPVAPPVSSPSPQTAPTAIDDSATATIGQPVTVNVLSNDTDPQNDIDPASVQITGTSNPGDSLTVAGEGVWSVNTTTGAITFTPEAGFTGDPTPISYTVKDATGLESNPATISIDYVPQLSINDVTVNEDAGTMTFTVTLSNPSTQNVTFDY